jgi:hypothetical protein
VGLGWPNADQGDDQNVAIAVATFWATGKQKRSRAPLFGMSDAPEFVLIHG